MKRRIGENNIILLRLKEHVLCSVLITIACLLVSFLDVVLSFFLRFKTILS